MSLFSTNEVRRTGYLLLFFALLAFDFIKPPVEKYLVHRQDQAQEIAFAPQPATPANIQKHGTAGYDAVISRNSPVFRAATIMQSIQQDAREHHKQLSDSELKQAFFRALTSQPENRKAVENEINVQFYNVLYLSTIFLMSGITIVSILWMITGRVRNIGWSQVVAIALIALYFAPAVVGPTLPPLLLKAANPTFFVLAFLLGLIPSQNAGNDRFPPLPFSAAVPLRPRKPGQFGRLGTT